MIDLKEIQTTVPVAEAKANLDALLDRVAEGGDAILIEREGKEPAAIISIEQAREYLALRKAQKRREAVEEIRRLQREISSRFTDMTEEEIEQIAQEIRHDVAQGLFEKGYVRYKE